MRLNRSTEILGQAPIIQQNYLQDEKRQDTLRQAVHRAARERIPAIGSPALVKSGTQRRYVFVWLVDENVMDVVVDAIAAFRPRLALVFADLDTADLNASNQGVT